MFGGFSRSPCEPIIKLFLWFSSLEAEILLDQYNFFLSLTTDTRDSMRYTTKNTPQLQTDIKFSCLAEDEVGMDSLSTISRSWMSSVGVDSFYDAPEPAGTRDFHGPASFDVQTEPLDDIPHKPCRKVSLQSIPSDIMDGSENVTSQNLHTDNVPRKPSRKSSVAVLPSIQDDKDEEQDNHHACMTRESCIGAIPSSNNVLLSNESLPKMPTRKPTYREISLGKWCMLGGLLYSEYNTTFFNS